MSRFVLGFSVSGTHTYTKSDDLAKPYSEGTDGDRKEARRQKCHTEDKFSALD